MSESLPHDEFEFNKIVNLEDVLSTPDDSDIGYFVEVDLNYLDNVGERRKFFPFVLRTKLVLKIKLVMI